MFGRSLFRVMGVVVVGVVALSLGRELLNSVTLTVLSFRAGNILPLITVAALTVILLRVPALLEKNAPHRVLLNVIAWSSVVYLSVTVLIVMLPFGILTAFSSTGVVILACGAISEPSEAVNKLSSIFQSTSGIMPLSLGEEGDTIFSASLEHQGFKVLLLPPSSREITVSLLKARSALPVSVVNLEGNDFMLVKAKTDKTLLAKMIDVLEEEGIPRVVVGRPLLTDAVVNLPRIEDDMGIVKMNEYRVAQEESVVEKILEIWPERMTIIPSKTGLRAIVRPDSVMGLELQDIPKRKAAKVVLGRDLSVFEKGDAVDGNTT